jgi:hypothetical protein
MADQQLVLGIFADEAAADAAVEQVKLWGTSYVGVKPGVIGVLVADGKGGIKEHKLGARSGGKGAGIGLVLAVVAPPTLLAGIAGGAILGHFHHKGLGLTDADRTRIGAELSGGMAAVGILVTAAEAPIVSAKLIELGGVAEAHAVSDEALEAVAAAAPAAPAEPTTPAAPAPDAG